jgi:hypothetical protein
MGQNTRIFSPAPRCRQRLALAVLVCHAGRTEEAALRDASYHRPGDNPATAGPSVASLATAGRARPIRQTLFGPVLVPKD